MKSAEATRERILAAATKEFATYGVAGARVDRIAKASASNKNLLYVYFGNKEQLFAAVLQQHSRRIHEAVPFAADDLSGYAVRLFDFMMENPDLMRLLAWYGLEQDRTEGRERSPSFEAKVTSLAKAQRLGVMSKEFTPAFLLNLVMALASVLTAVNPFSPLIDPGASKDLKAYRKAIAKTVERLCS